MRTATTSIELGRIYFFCFFRSLLRTFFSFFRIYFKYFFFLSLIRSTIAAAALNAACVCVKNDSNQNQKVKKSRLFKQIRKWKRTTHAQKKQNTQWQRKNEEREKKKIFTTNWQSQHTDSGYAYPDPSHKDKSMIEMDSEEKRGEKN